MVPRNIGDTANKPGDWLLSLDLDCIPAAAQHRVDEVLGWLNACAAFNMSLVPFRYTADNTASDGYFGTATWHARAFAAFKLIENQITPADRASLATWFIDAARWHAVHMDHPQYGIGAYFPARAAGDYTPKPGSAADTGARFTVKAHADAPELLSILSLTFNNRRAACWFFSAMVGIHYRDQPLIDGAKRYFKEWVRYSVYEDGSQGDWMRNETSRISYGYNSGGVTYSAYCNAAALLVAKWLHDIGDDELLEYRTCDGLHGTASAAPKSIFTPLDTHIAIFDGTKVFRDSLGVAMNQRSAPGGQQNHISWSWPAVRGDSRYPYLGRLLRTSPKIINDPYGPWRGMAGAFRDVRLAD